MEAPMQPTQPTETEIEVEAILFKLDMHILPTLRTLNEREPDEDVSDLLNHFTSGRDMSSSLLDRLKASRSEEK